MKTVQFATLTLDKIVGGGQALGTLEDGRKAFVWGGLPGEKVTISITKKKSHLIEGVVTEVVEASADRISPKDAQSYISTSPWQIMRFESEQHYKAALIEEAFELHDIVLPAPIEVFSDGREYGYRNKLEFSWYGHEVDGAETLDLSFFARGSHGKIPVEGSSLAIEAINICARKVRDALRSTGVTARELKTLLVRADQQGNCSWQLYIKDENPGIMSEAAIRAIGAQRGEIIYSDPKSPASRITKRLISIGDALDESILDTSFHYATEGFFQINLPVYEQALRDMSAWVPSDKPLVDMYAGVGTIGLTIGTDRTELIEIDENAVREMRNNIVSGAHKAEAILAPVEKALDYITADKTIVVDPPRAGLHRDVIDKLLEMKPSRIIYLSCNPVTQARDVALLAESYGVAYHRGYNFFPRTPHIEHLVILDLTN